MSSKKHPIFNIARAVLIVAALASATFVASSVAAAPSASALCSSSSGSFPYIWWEWPNQVAVDSPHWQECDQTGTYNYNLADTMTDGNCVSSYFNGSRKHTSCSSSGVNVGRFIGSGSASFKICRIDGWGNQVNCGNTSTVYGSSYATGA